MFYRVVCFPITRSPHHFHTLSDTSEDALIHLVDTLDQDPAVHGILVQLPLPKHINPDQVLHHISPWKDVDGFTASNAGYLCLRHSHPHVIPCTPLGCLELLKRSNVPISGSHAVVLGRSNIVGMPMAHLLLRHNATVTVCHSRTNSEELDHSVRDYTRSTTTPVSNQYLNQKTFLRNADIVIAAMGRPLLVKGDWIKPGAVVLDVGINYVPDSAGSEKNKIVGDVDFDEVKLVASQITPVPGGVGPMTIAMLMHNVLDLAELSQETI
eukprot:c8993_g1_i8.p1 GENE.c8993_g1_i8~~c8993_g1_i8.p1  ORF type:complete len:268 (+),score=8.59 c8993_g1_i8:325-1128(+)